MNMALWVIIGIAILYIVVFAVLQIRKNKKLIEQEKYMNEFHKGLRIDDYVITLSGLYGYIKSINDNKVKLEIAKDTVVTMDVKSILAILNK